MALLDFITGGVNGGSAINVDQQKKALQDAINKNKGINAALPGQLSPLTNKYQAGITGANSALQSQVEGANANLTSGTADLTNQAKDSLRKNLYGSTFSGLPDALRGVREASAAGGGIGSGAYQQGVRDIGAKTAQTLASGERDIQLAGLNNQQAALDKVNTNLNNVFGKLNDNQVKSIETALSTGREDTIRQTSIELGLNENEAQGLIDLMNFQQSGQLAANTAADANKTALLTSLIGGGARLAGGLA